jgi:hypothetical protein
MVHALVRGFGASALRRLSWLQCGGGNPPRANVVPRYGRIIDDVFRARVARIFAPDTVSEPLRRR